MLFITDSKNRSRPRILIGKAGIVEKRLGQSGDDAPLRRTGVLRLIDQNMLQPIIDFIQHPLRCPLAGQQAIGQRHKVVIIEHTAPRFLAGIIVNQRGGKNIKRLGQVIIAQRFQLLIERRHSARHSVHHRGKGRVRLCRFLGIKPVAGFPRIGEKHGSQMRPCAFRVLVSRRLPVFKARRLFLVIGRAGFKPRDQGVGVKPLGFLDNERRRAGQCAIGSAQAIELHGLCEARQIGRSARGIKCVAAFDNVAPQGHEIVFRQSPRQHGHGGGAGGRLFAQQQIGNQSGLQAFGVLFVHQVEMR